MEISKGFVQDAKDYANQGNSVIGIRGSGKTYGASKIGEELMDANIPIVVFDPTGVWQNLRNGINGHKGYPIVVAGGLNGDIPLTRDNAVQIMAAALKAGVSIIFDLQGKETSSKTAWRHIVASVIEFLMENNFDHGLRHVFIEEAAEFAPQKLSPGGQLVYAEIESLARMGRNFGLGYTLINQRSQEIAKPVFEISEMVISFRQQGKNSLTSIKDWLQLRGLDPKPILSTLPRLSAGHAWVINSEIEKEIVILPKKTFHPDPKSQKIKIPAGTHVADTKSFIAQINAAIAKPVTVKEMGSLDKMGQQVYEQRIEILKAEKLELASQVLELGLKNTRLLLKLKNISEILNDAEVTHQVELSTSQIKVAEVPAVKSTTPQLNSSPRGTGSLRMLKAAAMFHPKPITKIRMAALAGLRHTSGTFGTYINNLKKDGFITVDKTEVKITPAGIKSAGDFEPLPTDPDAIIEMWCNNVGSQSGAARILRYLGSVYPREIPKEQIGNKVDLVHTSGTFGTYLGTLKRNGLITVSGQMVKAANELFN